MAHNLDSSVCESDQSHSRESFAGPANHAQPIRSLARPSTRSKAGDARVRLLIFAHTPSFTHQLKANKMAAIVASNFAVAAPSKVAARKISSRKAALPGASMIPPIERKIQHHRVRFGEINPEGSTIARAATRLVRASSREARH